MKVITSHFQAENTWYELELTIRRTWFVKITARAIVLRCKCPDRNQ